MPALDIKYEMDLNNAFIQYVRFTLKSFGARLIEKRHANLSL